MDTATVKNAIKIRKSGEATLLTGTLTQSSTTIYFSPSSPLAAGTTYLVTVDIEATDRFGVPMTHAWHSEFTTVSP
jgi:hypothetical protein